MNQIPYVYTRLGNGYDKNTMLTISKNGIQMQNELLSLPAFRTGFFAALSSLPSVLRDKKRSVCGVMISGDNLPLEENGVSFIPSKMADVDDSERLLRFCNLSDDECSEIVTKLLKNQKKIEKHIDLQEFPVSYVLVGYDTRKSSGRLAQCAVDGVNFFGSPLVKPILFRSPITNPLQFFATRCDAEFGRYELVNYIQGYAESLAEKVTEVVGEKLINIDCSNGVVACWIKHYIPKHLIHQFKITNTTFGNYSKLNHNCGADYVVRHAKKIIYPKEMIFFDRSVHFGSNSDKLCYSFVNAEGNFCLLDGFHIALLFLDYIYELLKNSEITEEQRKSLKFGIATSHYTNGAFDRAILKYADIFSSFKSEPFINDLSEKIQEYDIGIYFLANGYGIVNFSTLMMDILSGEDFYLYELTTFFQYPTSDACAHMLAVEYILAKRNMSVVDWFNMYTPLPWALGRITVANYEEYYCDPQKPTILLGPKGIGNYIDGINTSGDSRVYVRQSEKKNVFVAYVEAETDGKVLKILKEVKMILDGGNDKHGE